MAVPLVRTLQTNFPQAAITWIISRPAYDLVEGMDGVEFIVIDKPSGIVDYWQFKRQMCKRQFDILLAIQSSFRANLLYACIRAKRKIGYDALRAKDGHSWFVHETITPGNDHTLDGFLRFAEHLGIKQKQIRWDLPIQTADFNWARAHMPVASGRPICLVNPAASKPERSWSSERYIEVIQYMQQRWQACVVLVGGPGAYDRQLGDAILQHVEAIDLIGKTKPKQLLAIISLADMLLCPDTGPSHMGTAVATPVVALHAVTSSEVSGPYLYRHLSVDFYPEAVRTILKKTDKTNPWGTHAHGSETMKLVTVESVIAKLEKALSKQE